MAVRRIWSGTARTIRRRPVNASARGTCMACWSSPSWRATAAPSIRWRRRSARLGSGCWQIPSTCTPTGRWSTTTRCRARCWRCRGCGSHPIGARCMIAAKGAPEAIVDLCHLDAAAAHELPRRSRPWRATGCACSASRGQRSMPTVLPGNQHDFEFEFLGLIALEDPGEARCAAGDCRVPRGRHAGRDDDRRSPRHRDLGGAAGRTTRRRRGHHRGGARRAER